MSTLVGKGSYFGGPSDPTDSGHTANGETTHTPGIAVYNHGTLNGYWRVTAPNGKSVVLKQTDIGPAPWTNRKIDVTYSALGKFGYGEHNFPTDSQFKAEYLGKNPGKQAPVQLSSAPSEKAAKALPGVTGGFDQAGFQKAQRAAVLGKLLSTEGIKDNPLFASGLASTRLPQRAEYQGEAKTPEQHILKAEGHSKFIPAGTNVTQLKGLVDFGGHKVAAWIAPALKYAQAHGWKGTVNSGYRSKAEQERIYNSGVRPAAVPGTSNHEGTEFPRGAVDVSEAQQLAQILKNSPYAHALVWAGAKDAVHFSHPHNGSY